MDEIERTALQGSAPGTAWWQRGVIYQIYPRSFQDTDGDGVGDLPGITRRLEYLRWLGVDAAWISPIYPSPMADFGYDVSEHCDIHPMFGTLDDFDRLQAEARRLRLRLILDYIPNHTSDLHPWFLESQASPENRYRDWYIWKDPAPGGGPPNNWLSVFGGPAWEFDPPSGQFYLHTYLKEQPDLNWRNPAVREAMFDVMRFWLERGVDGFRIDALAHCFKDAEFRDDPPNPEYHPGRAPYYQLRHVHSSDQPELLELIADMRRLADRYGDRVLIGESYRPMELLRRHYGEDGGGLSFPFNFQLIRAPWDAQAIRALVDAYEAQLTPRMWPNWVLGNHDRSRVATRIGPAAARVAAMLLLTLRGTPTLYYGDEIGMLDVPVPPDRVQDPYEKNVPGLGCGRDPERTPMQWTPMPGAGFTTGTPWLPLSDDFRQVNATVQRADSQSMLAFYRRLLELRAAHPALSIGGYRAVDNDQRGVLSYLRAQDERFLAVLNFLPQPCQATLAENFAGRIVLSTHCDRDQEPIGRRIALREHEAVLVRLDA